jgi:cardiolipin synthase
MHSSSQLLDACVQLAEEVSAEALDAIGDALEAGEPESCRVRLSHSAWQRCAEMVRVWKDESPEVSSAAMAAMLRGAVHAVAHLRSAARVDLVWSGPDTLKSTFRSTAPALLELISGAAESVYLVTFAAYRVPAVASALDSARARGVRVLFVLESDEASGGKVNFDPLPYLAPGGAPVDVYHWPPHLRKRDERGRHGTLHAKFAVADRRRLLVSSANLTENAFDLNIELGALLTGGHAPAEAAAHIDNLIRLGILVRR